MSSPIQNLRIGVANRGIPALRIGRTIREMGGIYVAFATEEDKTAPHVSKADKAYTIRTEKGYLDIKEIVRIAKQHDVKALHPGWGFAAENNRFPSLCKENGIVFIGPSEDPMKKLGNKVTARNIAKSVSVPVIPGADKAVDLEEAKQIAGDIGYPVMIKSEGGGGGRGIVIVKSPEELEHHFIKASAIAEASFDNPNLYIEKFLTSVRHMEIQAVCDSFGNAVVLDERDCSTQRNNQKLLEITPSPWKGMSEELRKALKDATLKISSAVGYDSIGTFEFLVDEKQNFYFIEANTRLQVEHGITEILYGIDLVEEMIWISFGEKLRLKQDDLKPRGYAMQCRINFEDPQNNFQPNAGEITRYLSPGGEGVRLDSCVFYGYEFPKVYDSLASLLMTHGSTWEKTLAIMDRALLEYFIGGLKTTISFHKKVISHPKFRAGEIDTRFIDNTPELMSYREVVPEEIRLANLMAEITAKGYNPYVGFGAYRKFGDSKVGPMAVNVSSVTKSAADDISYTPLFDPNDSREKVLSSLRNSKYVEFCNTTPRDITQSETGNRFRVFADRLIGPIIDRCRYVSIENGGGAHYHVAMLGCMTDPWEEAADWNEFAPNTQKLILIRSTNVLGYAPQCREVMKRTGEMIVKHYHVIRCFDFLNHIENMAPFAEIVLKTENRIFQPAISLSWAQGFDVPHYLGVLDDILSMVGRILECNKDKASREIILCLKDMAGVCPPRFIKSLVSAMLDKYPDLIIQYHRHATDGLAVSALGAAAQAGVRILDVADGPSVRFYGQTAVMPVMAYIEGELGLKTRLDKERIRETAFVLKQIMPVYDHYCRPTFLGIDYDVTLHGLPGGATSSSQEGALKQGYAFLLPSILLVLELYRKLIRYHDVTPGSQITWTNGYMMVVKAYERGGMSEVQRIIDLLKKVTSISEDKLNEQIKEDRKILFVHANDALKNLLLGKFGKLPLGWPQEWIYQSVFEDTWEDAIASRTEESPLDFLPSVNIDELSSELASHIGRKATENELINYLNHPGDALKLIKNLEKFADPNALSDDIWFEGLEPGVEREFRTSDGKIHIIEVVRLGRVSKNGTRRIRYRLDHEVFVKEIQVEKRAAERKGIEMADESDPYQIGAPFDADLWLVHKKAGDNVKAGEEIFNLALMKVEYGITSPVDGVVKRVPVFADYKTDKKMVPVTKGQLLMELALPHDRCANCNEQIDKKDKYCSNCGKSLNKS
ncbi:MAG: pyruvate carboxylase [Deltaproteobacteria bacterium]|nr:pyruvate carboxylase [Deltaproteobacteria bacterium]MBW2661112.1 pyruvate carboxylase [Deltaproteobacteria bacterium]